MAEDVADVVGDILEVIVNPLIELLFIVATIVFFLGVIQFLVSPDKSAEGAEKGRRHMLWGIIGMFVMVAVFGIMRLIINTLGVELPAGAQFL